MTVERRFIANLMDIRAVTLECKKCHGRWSMTPRALEKVEPWKCPICQHAWLPGSKTTESWFSSMSMVFLRSLPQALKEEEDKEIGVRILLEFDEPTSGSTLASPS